MAHPQTNFSSNFQNAQVLDAKLDIKINGRSNEYQPSGEDKTVELVEPIIFEASDNPTFVEVNDAIAKHVPVYIHVSGTGVDYMLPYVGQSNAENQLYFAMPDTQSNGIRYYVIRNGAAADTGIKEFDKDRGFVQINRKWSGAHSPKVKLCELNIGTISDARVYTYALSIAAIISNNGAGDCPCESGIFDLAVNIISAVNVYRVEGRWHGYDYDFHQNHESRVLEGITVAWSPDHTKLEVYADLGTSFTGASSLSVSAIINEGSSYIRSTSTGLEFYKTPWEFINTAKFMAAEGPAAEYTTSTFPTVLSSEVYRLVIADPEANGILHNYYRSITDGVTLNSNGYKTAVLQYGTGQIAYLQNAADPVRFVNYNAALSRLEIFTVSPTAIDGYHAVTKSVATLGSTDIYKASILDPVSSGMTVEQFNVISSNSYKTAVLEYSMGGSTLGEAILVSKGANGLAFAVYASGANKLVVFEVASSVVNGVHPITRSEVAVGGSGDTGIVVFEVSYSENIADYVYPTYQEMAAAVSAGKMPVILRYEHNSPVRHCFVFRWLSGDYIHFDNNSQYVEISNENVVETGYIQNVLIYTFSGSNYPSADDISLAIANEHDIILCKYTASDGGIAHVHYRLNKYIAITSGITIEFYPTDNSMKYIKAFKDLTATEPTWVWSLEDTNVMNMIGNVETLLAAL